MLQASIKVVEKMFFTFNAPFYLSLCVDDIMESVQTYCNLIKNYNYCDNEFLALIV